MDYCKLGTCDLEVSVICLGTWAFGNDSWWGHQDEADSRAVLEGAVSKGINFIDTAPVYGRGHSEEVIGKFLRSSRLRTSVILATKAGLRWDGRQIYHDLSRQRVSAEFDHSRKRLNTDYFDLYQAHWPDPDTPISETAEVFAGLYNKGLIKAVGVSNYSVAQMSEFMRSCPLHSLQPQYSMFWRDIEDDVVPFCQKHNIAIISYAPLYSGILTGKFFFDNARVPADINRKIKKNDLEEPRLSINKAALSRLRDCAANYGKNLTQLAINWNFSQPGITSAIVGTRNAKQLIDNLGSVGWKISSSDMEAINKILHNRRIDLNNLI